MDRSITLAADVSADAEHLFEILSTTEGQRGFWPPSATSTPITPVSASRNRLSA